MKFRSYGTPEFWRAYREQPAAVRALAQKTYRLWSEDALHPSLHFKKIKGGKWSILTFPCSGTDKTEFFFPRSRIILVQRS